MSCIGRDELRGVKTTGRATDDEGRYIGRNAVSIEIERNCLKRVSASFFEGGVRDCKAEHIWEVKSIVKSD